jgi:hypothetical protein
MPSVVLLRIPVCAPDFLKGIAVARRSYQLQESYTQNQNESDSAHLVLQIFRTQCLEVDPRNERAHCVSVGSVSYLLFRFVTT